MKFEARKSYKTRGGEEAFIYCVDAPGAMPIHGRIGTVLYCWTEGGHILSIYSHNDDLIAPEPERMSRKVWVNIYSQDPYFCYETEQSAKSASRGHIRIAVPCLLTEITE